MLLSTTDTMATHEASTFKMDVNEKHFSQHPKLTIEYPSTCMYTKVYMMFDMCQTRENQYYGHGWNPVGCICLSTHDLKTIFHTCVHLTHCGLVIRYDDNSVAKKLSWFIRHLFDGLHIFYLNLWNLSSLAIGNMSNYFYELCNNRSESTLDQVMPCCLTAPSHYMNQSWLIRIQK